MRSVSFREVHRIGGELLRSAPSARRQASSKRGSASSPTTLLSLIAASCLPRLDTHSSFPSCNIRCLCESQSFKGRCRLKGPSGGGSDPQLQKIDLYKENTRRPELSSTGTVRDFKARNVQGVDRHHLKFLNIETDRRASRLPGGTRKARDNHDISPWQVQKNALKQKFGHASWNPRKRLSPDAIEGIRELHKQYPNKYTTPVLAKQFEVSPEAIRRILKSQWRPSEEEEADRRRRWDKRGESIWSRWVKTGLKPPKKWREMGVGTDTRHTARNNEHSAKFHGLERCYQNHRNHYGSVA